MQFLALSRRLEGTTPQMLAPLAADEARAAWQLHMCPDRPGSVLVLECGSLDEARALLQRLPMVRAGLIDFDVSRMLPYTGWAALFGPEHGA